VVKFEYITTSQSLINTYITEKQFATHKEHTALQLQIPVCECCVGKLWSYI